MIVDVVIAVCALAVPALYPVFRLMGPAPQSFFVLPLFGGIVTAFAALLVLLVGGSIGAWYLTLAVATNAAFLLFDARGRRRGAHVPRRGRASSIGTRWGTGLLVTTIVAIGVAVSWPLQPLRGRYLAYDTNAVWLVHAIWIFSGHTAFFAGTHPPAHTVLAGLNPDYPPLGPAATALGFYVPGHVVYDMEPVLLAVLNACAVAVLACGIVAAAQAGTRLARGLAIVLAMGIGVAAFGPAGIYAVGGYADLLWSAAAAAAVVYGLILPKSRSNLAVMWIGATVAALAKNDGLPLAILILVLTSIRYVPASSPDAGTAGALAHARLWLRPLGLACLMALPGAMWAIVMRLSGVSDAFFGSPRPQPILDRVGPTVSGISHHLDLLPFVVVIAVTGAVFLRDRRRTLGLGNDWWVWGVLLASVVVTMLTYVFGDLDIHWWLETSVDRTAIFPQLLLYTDVALWMIVGSTMLDGNAARRVGTPRSALEPDPAETSSVRTELAGRE